MPYHIERKGNERLNSKKPSFGYRWIAVLSILLFTNGQSMAQTPADDVYVAPQRFFVQKLAEDVKAKHPEIMYLNLRTIPPGRTESFKVASSPPSRGGKSDAEDLQVEHTGKPIVEQVKDAPHEFRVLLPLRERPGTIIGNIAIRMKLAEGQTTADALKLGEKINRELQNGITSKEKLFSPA